VVASKFNGNIVSKLTGLVDKELGWFMQELRKNSDFNPNRVMYFTQDQICAKIRVEYETYMKA